MGKWIVRLLGAAVVAAGVLGIVFVGGMRRKSPAVVDAVRRFNREFGNPHVMKTAGTPGASASVIRHVGRTSGRAYETPVGPFPTDDGYVVALPYGLRADWVKNVLAAGSAELVHQGETVSVDRPEVVPTAEVEHLLPASEPRVLSLFAVDQCLRLRRAEAAA